MENHKVSSLEPDAALLQNWFNQLQMFTEKFVGGLKSAKVVSPVRISGESLGIIHDSSTSFEDLMREIDEILLRQGGLDTASGRYFGYIPGGGLPAAAFGDFLAALTNRYAGMFQPGPGAVQIENEVIRWLLKEFDYGASAWGTLLSGGSLANFSAIVTARETWSHADWSSGVLYLTEQAHHSLARGIRMAGLAHVQRRLIPVDREMRMDPRLLREQIAADVGAGLKPWMIFASAGTTNSGAIDPLSEISAIARGCGAWFHVDAAYGGFFFLTDVGKPLLAGISSADSIVLDPHKGLFQPYGCGALLVKDGRRLKAAFSESAEYLADAQDETEPSPCDYSPELSRHFRGLRVWLSLRLAGVSAFRAALEEKLVLTRGIYERLRQMPELEFAHEPELSLIAFRVKGSGDASTRELHSRILERGRVHMSTTQIRGKLYIRVCVLSFRSHQAEVDGCYKEITAALGR